MYSEGMPQQGTTANGCATIVDQLLHLEEVHQLLACAALPDTHPAPICNMARKQVLIR
jgi:hypothetical protein